MSAAMDLLDIDNEALYCDQPLGPETEHCLSVAALHYGRAAAETALMRAYFLEPRHLMVLVALYRFFFYQQRYQEALMVAERTLDETGRQLYLSGSWRTLNLVDLGAAVQVSMTLTRFYLAALKGAAYLELRLGEYRQALARLTKVAELDPADRTGVVSLIELAREACREQPTGL